MRTARGAYTCDAVQLCAIDHVGALAFLARPAPGGAPASTGARRTSSWAEEEGADLEDEMGDEEQSAAEDDRSCSSSDSSSSDNERERWDGRAEDSGEMRGGVCAGEQQSLEAVARSHH